jgi:heme exporter protein A
MADPAPLLSLSGLTKRFGFTTVLDGVSLDLHAGELVLLLGPNGAGKTTLSRVLTTLTRPSSTGQGGPKGASPLRFKGEPVGERNRAEFLRKVGYLSHQTFLYAHLTAEENLRFFGRLFGMDRLEGRIGSLLEQVGLAAAGKKQVDTFSRGMLQRLSMARVLLTDPEMLILDEPYSGLDPAGSRTLTELLAGLRSGRRAILLITHELDDCLPIADRAAILHRGRVVWESPARGLSAEALRDKYFEVAGEGGRP